MTSKLILAGVAISAWGCATGAPLTARRSTHDTYATFSPPARARAVPEAPVALQQPLVFPAGARGKTLAVAAGLLGKPHVVVDGKRFPDDCTGLVRGVYASLGVDVFAAAEPQDNGVTAIWRFAQTHGRTYTGGLPVAGDLVFFRDTYDLNRDGHVNDGLTHIGIVSEVGADGTVTVIHRVARGVVSYRMNLSVKDSATDAQGKQVNDWLRSRGAGNSGQLTSQLFAGYATVLPVESRFARR